MKISFDFDNVLSSHDAMTKLFDILLNTSNEIFILTSRNEIFENKILWDFVFKHNFNKENVLFTQKEKWKKIKEKNIELHFDDDFFEVNLINKKLGSKKNKIAVLVDADSSWLSTVKK